MRRVLQGSVLKKRHQIIFGLVLALIALIGGQTITFYCYSQQYFYLNASTSSSITGTSFGTHIKNDGWRVQNQENTFTLDLTYTPAPNKSISATFTPVRSGSSSFSSNDTNLMAYIPNSLENATIIFSGTGIDSSKDLSNAVIYEFSVTKP